VTDCDHALHNSESHQYQSLAELTRRAQRNNNRLSLQASRSSANAVLDRLSCSCFAVAVGTIVVVTLVSMATVLISGEEKKLKETEIIVEKIQMNEKPVPLPKSSALNQAENLNQSASDASLITDRGSNRQNGSDDTSSPLSAVGPKRGGVDEEKAAGDSTVDENRFSAPAMANKRGIVGEEVAIVGPEVVVAVDTKDANANDGDDEDDHDVASPQTKELLHAARENNKPRTVSVGEEALIERKILPLTPGDTAVAT